VPAERGPHDEVADEILARVDLFADDQREHLLEALSTARADVLSCTPAPTTVTTS